jgi:hypothetical protein
MQWLAMVWPTAIRDRCPSFTGVLVQKPYDVQLPWIELEPLDQRIDFARCVAPLDLRATELGRILLWMRPPPPSPPSGASRHGCGSTASGASIARQRRSCRS